MWEWRFLRLLEMEAVILGKQLFGGDLGHHTPQMIWVIWSIWVSSGFDRIWVKRIVFHELYGTGLFKCQRGPLFFLYFFPSVKEVNVSNTKTHETSGQLVIQNLGFQWSHTKVTKFSTFFFSSHEYCKTFSIMLYYCVTLDLFSSSVFVNCWCEFISSVE